MITLTRHLTAFVMAAALASAQDPSPPVPAPADAKAVETKPAANPVVEMKTSMGTITLELDQAKAPLTVANFLKYVEGKHYDGTVFHRIIDSFMIQGGGFEKKGDQLVEKATNPPIKNEAANGLKNLAGTIAMARTNAPDSATSQFYINVKDNSALDQSTASAGYAVFGKVTHGIEVVNQIKGVRTGVRELSSRLSNGQLRPMPSEDVPVADVVIESVRVVPGAPAK